MLELEIPTFKEILEEARGNEQLLEELLDKFRLWLKQQLHLPQDISEQRLQFYICSAKFNLEKAKKRLDTHYTIRNMIPEIFSNRDPLDDNLIRAMTCMQWVYLPKLTPENYRLCISWFTHNDSSMFDVYETLKYIYMILEMHIEENIHNSEVIIYDCSNLTFNHIIKFTPSVLKKADTILESYGLRIKAIHMINAPSFIDIFVSMIKAVMKAKLVNRIHIHTSGIESLYEIIPRSILPIEYGGDHLSINTVADMWRAKLTERRNWYLEQEKVKVNESLRSLSNSVINPNDLFGVSGTFRKLNID